MPSPLWVEGENVGRKNDPLTSILSPKRRGRRNGENSLPYG